MPSTFVVSYIVTYPNSFSRKGLCSSLRSQTYRQLEGIRRFTSLSVTSTLRLMKKCLNGRRIFVYDIDSEESSVRIGFMVVLGNHKSKQI